MNLDGSAEIGVSMSLKPAGASRFAACGFVDMGGAGRAKGLGGPWAPALSKAPALGEGGGRTTWEGGPGWLVVGGWEVEEGSWAALVSPSLCSLGIWTLSLGRFAASEVMVLLRVGGRIWGTPGALSVRWGGCWGERAPGRAGGGCGEMPLGRFRCMAATSMDCERGPSSTFTLGSERGGSALLVLPQLRASIERLSSIGVNIL